jgi:hypothetical protein
MKKLEHLLDSWSVFTLTLCVAGAYAVVFYWPASYWLEVAPILAGPARAGKAVPMAVERSINRDFVGSWTVSVKQYSVAGWVSFCSASGQTRYTKDAKLPANLDLGWWTDGRCPSLPVGRYLVDTVWSVHSVFWGLPTKDVVIRSNIFEVTP